MTMQTLNPDGLDRLAVATIARALLDMKGNGWYLCGERCKRDAALWLSSTGMEWAGILFPGGAEEAAILEEVFEYATGGSQRKGRVSYVRSK